MSNKEDKSFEEKISLTKELLLTAEKGDAETRSTSLGQVLEISRVLTEENPKSLQAWLVLGLAEYWSNEATAQKSFETALGLVKKSENEEKITCLYHLGKINLAKNDFQNAETSFKKVLKIKSNHINTLHDLSVVYAKTERIKEAIKCLKMVIKENSDFPGAAENLSVLLFHEE
tara:strand:- start:79 stop:600 length:522 start_codon:yes stop_codon:yes gene_type:complete